jgi:hypothetical protein
LETKTIRIRHLDDIRHQWTANAFTENKTREDQTTWEECLVFMTRPAWHDVVLDRLTEIEKSVAACTKNYILELQTNIKTEDVSTSKRLFRDILNSHFAMVYQHERIHSALMARIILLEKNRSEAQKKNGSDSNNPTSINPPFAEFQIFIAQLFNKYWLTLFRKLYTCMEFMTEVLPEAFILDNNNSKEEEQEQQEAHALYATWAAIKISARWLDLKQKAELPGELIGNSTAAMEHLNAAHQQFCKAKAQVVLATKKKKKS